VAIKKYNIIYADPPWEVLAGPDYGSGGKSKLLSYPTMTVPEIKALRVCDLAAKDAHLYLWTINKYIYDSYEVARTWGFTASTLLTWCKSPHGIGLGGTFIQTTEHLLFCRRGNLPAQTRIDTTYFQYKRLSHSTKPKEVREMIVEVSGDLPRVELFAREKVKGWDSWGNEIECDINFEEEQPQDLLSLFHCLDRTLN